MDESLVKQRKAIGRECAKMHFTYLAEALE
jgi:hypothetical protein